MMTGIFSGCGAKEPVADNASVVEDDASQDEPIAETAPSAPVADADAGPFTIYRESDGAKISLGENREHAESILGSDEYMVLDFEEDNIQRVEYYDNEGVTMDYDTGDIIRAMRFEANGWKIFNGIAIGNPVSGAKTNYPAEHLYKFPQNDDVWISYDENGNTVPFSLESKYIITLKVKEEKVVAITIQDNF